MGLKLSITIEGAKPIDSGVWKARLEPEEVATLGNCKSRLGPYSVLLLESGVDYNRQHASLTFDPSTTRLLNIGSTAQILVLSHMQTSGQPLQANGSISTVALDHPAAEALAADRSAPARRSRSGAQEPAPGLTTGDKLFLSELPSGLRDLGENLLREVRSRFSGELCFEPRSAKFDETPMLFWTVKILPQEKALRVTVRGTPESLPNPNGIDLKLDKYGYSAFFLVRPSQISAAMRIIARGRKNMQR